MHHQKSRRRKRLLLMATKAALATAATASAVHATLVDAASENGGKSDNDNGDNRRVYWPRGQSMDDASPTLDDGSISANYDGRRRIPTSMLHELHSLSRTLRSIQTQNALSAHSLDVFHSMQNDRSTTAHSSWLDGMEREVARMIERRQQDGRRRLTMKNSDGYRGDDIDKWRPWQQHTTEGRETSEARWKKSNLRRRGLSFKEGQTETALDLKQQDQHRKLGRAVGKERGDLPPTMKGKSKTAKSSYLLFPGNGGISGGKTNKHVAINVVSIPPAQAPASSGGEDSPMVAPSMDNESDIGEDNENSSGVEGKGDVYDDDDWLEDVTFDDYIEECYAIDYDQGYEDDGGMYHADDDAHNYGHDDEIDEGTGGEDDGEDDMEDDGIYDNGDGGKDDDEDDDEDEGNDEREGEHEDKNLDNGEGGIMDEEESSEVTIDADEEGDGFRYWKSERIYPPARNADGEENLGSNRESRNSHTRGRLDRGPTGRKLVNTYYVYDYHAKTGKKSVSKSRKADGSSIRANDYATSNAAVDQNSDDSTEDIAIVMPSSHYAKSGKMAKDAKSGTTKSGKACLIVEEVEEEEEQQYEDEEEQEEEEEEEQEDGGDKYCGTDFDDASSLCEIQCNSDADCPGGESCFSGVAGTDCVGDDETSSPPTSMPIASCPEGCPDCDPESPLPCPPSDLKRVCDKDNPELFPPESPRAGERVATFVDCYDKCKPSFCCIHDSLSKEYSPSCAREYENCPLYYPCYVIWWKLHDTIGPATYLRLEQDEPFYEDLNFEFLEKDLAQDEEFFQQLFGHHFDTDDAPNDEVFEDPENW